MSRRVKALAPSSKRLPEGVEETEIRQLIRRRRLQIIVHSIIYYRLGSSIIPDYQFDEWGRELVNLQKRYPIISKNLEYYEDFKDWDATTGYHLKSLSNPNLIALAQSLLHYHIKKFG